MRSYTFCLSAVGLLATSGACSLYGSGGFGGQTRIAGASSGGGARGNGAVGGSNLGTGRARMGGGLGLRAWEAGDDSVVAWGPEIRNDLALTGTRWPYPSFRRWSLASRMFVGTATRYGRGEDAQTGSAFDASLGISYELMRGEKSVNGHTAVRPGAGLFTGTLNISRIPTISGGSAWLLGMSVEFTGVVNVEYLFNRM